MLNAPMREKAIKQMTYPAPLIPTAHCLPIPS